MDQPLSGHQGWTTSVAFSPDGTQLASGDGDGVVILWDVTTGQQQAVLPTGHSGPVWFLHFAGPVAAPRLLTGNGDGTLIQWDLQTLEPLSAPLHSLFEVESMALSPDETTLAMGAFDNTGLVHLWRIDTTPWPVRACRIANRDLSQEEWQKYLGDKPYQATCSE